MSQRIAIGSSTDVNHRYKMPQLMAQTQGSGNGIKTCIANLDDVARALSRPPEYLLKYFGVILGAQTKHDPKSGMGVVNGAHTVETLRTLRDDFIKKFVFCGRCVENPETQMLVRKGHISLHCKSCGGVTDVAPDKLTDYILKHPPSEKAKSMVTTADRVQTAGSMTDLTTAEGASSPQEAAEEPKVEAFASQDVDELAKDIDKFNKEAQAENPVEALHAYVEAHPDASAEDIEHELLRHMNVHHLDLDDGVLLLFASKVITPENLLPKLKLWIAVLKPFAEEEEGVLEKPVLNNIAEMLGEKETPVHAHMPAILNALYDADVFAEKPLLKWFKRAKSKSAPKAYQRLRKASKPFLDWLKSAEEDSGEEA